MPRLLETFADDRCARRGDVGEYHLWRGLVSLCRSCRADLAAWAASYGDDDEGDARAARRAVALRREALPRAGYSERSVAAILDWSRRADDAAWRARALASIAADEARIASRLHRESGGPEQEA